MFRTADQREVLGAQSRGAAQDSLNLAEVLII